MQVIDLLNKISKLQVREKHPFFNIGLFPSYRTNNILKLIRPDDNIFFSASVLYVLQSLTKFFNAEEIQIVKEIGNLLIPNFQHYTNKPERNSYNFWQKKEGKHFPNGTVLHKLSKFKLPDDIDTTSLIQMVNRVKYDEALKTKKCLPNYANGYKYWVRNGYEQFKIYKAYSTWFGEKMPIELDACVLSNCLLWICYNNFKLKENDFASIMLLEDVVFKSLYFSKAFQIAPEYPKSEIIIYHLARLASKSDYLANVTNKLIDDIKLMYNTTNNRFAKLILQTSLLRLGIRNSDDLGIKSIDIDNYWWFTAGMISVYSNTILQQLAPMSVFHFRFISPSFNWALVLENQVLKKSFE